MSGETSQPTKSHSRFRIPWRELLVAICSLVLGAAIAWGAQKYDSRIRELSYSIQSSSGIIDAPSLKGRKVDVSVDGRKIENISSVRVLLFNLTDRDYENLPLFVDFTAEAGRPELLGVQMATPPETYQIVSENVSSDVGLSFAYTLPVVNRSNRAVFQAEFYFEGPVAPNASFRGNLSGVKLAEFDPRQAVAWSWEAWLIVILAFIGTATTGGILLGAATELVQRWVRGKTPETETGSQGPGSEAP